MHLRWMLLHNIVLVGNIRIARRIVHLLGSEEGSAIPATPEICRHATCFCVGDLALAESFYAGLSLVDADPNIVLDTELYKCNSTLQ